MPRSAPTSRGAKRQRTSAPATTAVDEHPAEDAPASTTLPEQHLDPAINSLLQTSAVTDPPSPPAASLSSHYFDAHIGSGRAGSRRRNQRSLLSVRQEAIQAGFDSSIPLLCKDAGERSARLLAEHSQLFPKWHMQLKHGMSVLLYGFGSKKRLLTSFARQWLTDGSVIVVNGYSRGFTAKHLLNAITQQILLTATTHRDLPAHLAHITQFFTSPAAAAIPHVYIACHSIDGPAMRSVAVQSLLAELVRLPAFHLIATADHVSTPLLFPPASLPALSFVSYRCDTWLPYTVEVRAAGLALGEEVVAGSAASGVRGVGDVVSSLTPSHRELLAVLGEMWMARVEERERERARRDEQRKEKRKKEVAARNTRQGKRGRTVEDVEQQQQADIQHDNAEDEAEADDDDDMQVDGEAAEGVESGSTELSATLRGKVSLALSDIVHRANEAMLGRGEATIRALTRELLDHQLVVAVTRRSKAAAGGTQQQYVIPHSHDVIRRHYTRTAQPDSTTAVNEAADGKAEVDAKQAVVTAAVNSVFAEMVPAAEVDDFPEETERKRGRGRPRKAQVSDDDEDGEFLL